MSFPCRATFASTAAALTCCAGRARSVSPGAGPFGPLHWVPAFTGYMVRRQSCPGAKARASGAAPPLSRPASLRACGAPGRRAPPAAHKSLPSGRRRPSTILSAALPARAALRPLFGLRSAPAVGLAPGGVAVPTLLRPPLSIASAPLRPLKRGPQVSRPRHPRGHGSARQPSCVLLAPASSWYPSPGAYCPLPRARAGTLGV